MFHLLITTELRRYKHANNTEPVPGSAVTSEMRSSFKVPAILSQPCEIGDLINFLDGRDRTNPGEWIIDLFDDSDTFKDFVNVCILPTVTIGRMNNIGRYSGMQTAKNSFFDVVTKYDIAFAILVLDDRYSLFNEVATRLNKELNVTHYMQRKLNPEEEKQFGQRSLVESDFCMYTGAGTESAGRGWTRYGVERFNAYVNQIDEYVRDYDDDYTRLGAMITKFWIDKPGVTKKKRKRDDGERAEGGICNVQAVCGL